MTVSTPTRRDTGRESPPPWRGRWLLGFVALLLGAPAAAAPGLWVARDADTEITLFGTIHALPATEKWLDARIATRLDAADSLVLETVIPDDQGAFATLVSRIGMSDQLKPLAARLPAAQAKRLPAAAASLGLPLPMLDRMATWLAAISISEASTAKLGISAQDGVEPALTKRAKLHAKPIIGLETPEQQLNYLANLPAADQMAMLVATIDDLPDARTETDALMAAWRAGDIDRIAADFAAEAKASPLLTKTLLTDRNRRWADWIAGLMRRPGQVFVAVGAGHMGGPDGLVAMLRARGLKVEPVPDLKGSPAAPQ